MGKDNVSSQTHNIQYSYKKKLKVGMKLNLKTVLDFQNNDAKLRICLECGVKSIQIVFALSCNRFQWGIGANFD